MHHITLLVGGMACRRCVREVTALLRDVAGVETVAADPRESVVRLSGEMTRADVLAAFSGTGYRPEVLPGAGDHSSGTAIGQPTS